MANTYSLLASTVLTGSQLTVTFLNIPQNYTDLVLKVSARADSADAYLTYNGTSTTVYSQTDMQGTGSLAQSQKSSNLAYIRLNNFTSQTTANTFNNAELYIPSYTASINKPMSSISADERNTTAGFIDANAGLFRDTTTITSLTLNSPGTTGFASGSSFYLYGISKS